MYVFWVIAGFLLRPVFYSILFTMAVLRKISLRSLPQRSGFSVRKPLKPVQSIWIHLASVGEFNTAKTFLNNFHKKTDYTLIFSCTNEDVIQAARKSLIFAEIFFLPVESPSAIFRIVRNWKVKAYLGFEVEIWPVLSSVLSLCEVKSFILGAYLYDEIYRSYQKWNRLLRPSFASYTGLACRSEKDRHRLVSLGSAEKTTVVCGDLKYDLDFKNLSRSLMRKKYSIPQNAHLLVMGSIHPGEEEILIHAAASAAEKNPHAYFVFAPRNLSMCAQLPALTAAAGLVYRLRTDKKIPTDCRVLILNTIGELKELYAAADLAFVGGSLINHGGHNFLEPVFYGVKTFCGPDISHFKDIHNQFAAEISLVASDDVAAYIRKHLPSKKNNAAVKKLTALRGAGKRMQIWLDKQLKD